MYIVKEKKNSNPSIMKANIASEDHQGTKETWQMTLGWCAPASASLSLSLSFSRWTRKTTLHPPDAGRWYTLPLLGNAWYFFEQLDWLDTPTNPSSSPPYPPPLLMFVEVARRDWEIFCRFRREYTLFAILFRYTCVLYRD